MAGYRREELLDGDEDESMDGSGGHIVFSSNLTSIGNPVFSSSRQLMLDDAQPAATEELLVSNSGHQAQTTLHNNNYRQSATPISANSTGGGVPVENFSISFISSSNYERKRFFWSRLTPFEKMLSSVIVILGLVIVTLAITLLIQPTPLLQVHLNKDDHRRKSFLNMNLHINRNNWLQTEFSLLLSLYRSSAQPCLTPKCISIASSIIESLDPMVDPCVNFYDYAWYVFYFLTSLPLIFHSFL